MRNGLIRGMLAILLVLALAAMPLLAASAKEEAPTPHPTVATHWYAPPIGGSGYYHTYGCVTIINKYHPWLKALFTTEKGAYEPIQLIDREPKLRPITLIYGSDTGPKSAILGLPPYKKKHTNLRVLFLCRRAATNLVTLDPNIKSWSDLAGKRLALFPVGHSGTVQMELILRYGYGILDKIDVTYHDRSGMMSALRDRLVDATVGTAGMVSGLAENKWSISPDLLELTATKDVYWVSIDQWALDNVFEATGLYMPVNILTKGMFDGEPEKDVLGAGVHNGFWVDEAMEDEVAYDIVKTIYEHDKEIHEIHKRCASINGEDLARYGVSEEWFHPGALKFFKEKGLKIGT